MFAEMYMTFQGREERAGQGGTKFYFAEKGAAKEILGREGKHKNFCAPKQPEPQLQSTQLQEERKALNGETAKRQLCNERQQAKGGSPVPLLRPGEATSGALQPVLGSPAQGATGETPVEGFEDNKGTGASLCPGKGESPGAVQVEKSSLRGNPIDADQ